MNVLALAGSFRKESYNRKALQVAKKIASEAGAMVKEFDLKGASLPMFDADVEADGTPSSVEVLRLAIQNADVLLIATPEYNRSVPGGLKNAIDWASREPNVLDGKIAGIFGVSPSQFGTVRAQLHLRPILNALNVLVTSQPEVYIGGVNEDTFNSDGSFSDEKTTEFLKMLVINTLDLASKISK